MIWRTQWNVGQGGFHTALFEGDGRRIRYVYDCGSYETSELHAAIDEFAASLEERPRIDVVVLSHIDSDHVNGLDRLLRLPNVTVDLVLLPFLSIAERLFQLARQAAAPSAFVAQLLADPVEAIRQRHPEARVLFVRSAEDPLPPDSSPALEPDPDESDGTDASGPLIIDAHGRRRAAGTSGSSVEDDISVRLASGSRDAWLLRFWATPHTDKKLDDFLALAAAGLSHFRPGLSGQELANLTARDLVSLLQDPRTEAALRRAYKLARVNTNGSSLVMLSDVDGKQGARQYVHFGSGGLIWGDAVMLIGAHSGWLHTGDARLGRNASRKIATHFGAALSSVAVLTLPHHGSEENFHAELLKQLPNVRLALAHRGPHADRMHWAHPHPTVIAQVCASSVLPWIVSTQPATRVCSYTET